MRPLGRWRPLGLVLLAGVILVGAVVAASAGRDLLSPPGPATASPVASATGPQPSETAQAPASSPTTTASPAIGLRHIWVIVLENRSYGEIIGSASAPFLNQLADRYGLATDYHAIARPSQPNYIALLSGSTQGVTDNDPHDLRAPNLLDQLDAAGIGWRVFAENVPSGCFRGAAA